MNNITEEIYTVRTEKDPESGRVVSRTWLNDKGEEHNRHGPAHVIYDPDGSLKKQVWKIGGIKHRNEDDGPALIERDPESGLVYREYYNMNALHRIKGPAIIVAQESSGKIIQQRFFRDGIDRPSPTGPGIS